MHIDRIREEIGIQISQNEEWLNKLDDTEPGHYGVESFEPFVPIEGVWVDIPSMTFTFKSAEFNFTVMLGSGSEEDGVKQSFSFPAEGKGTFVFIPNNGGVQIERLEINCNLDLFSEQVV